MKVIVFTATVLFIGIRGFSQDIIVTKTTEQIRAKIIEVTDDNVSYKKYHDQEGATFVIRTDKIKVILWENGDIDDYEKKMKEASVKGNSPSVSDKDRMPIIDKQGYSFYLDNGKVYDSKQLKQFLTENNLTPIWDKFARGSNNASLGGIFIGLGVAMDAVGTVLILDGMANLEPDKYLGGVILCSVGSFFVIVGIPTAIVGTVQKNGAINDYNTLYGGRPRIQYSQNVTFKAGFVGNGLGVSINF